MDILNDAAGFWLYDLAILKIWESHLNFEMDFKSFRNPKMTLNIFVIPIPFCNGFQTIEVQVISFWNFFKKIFLVRFWTNLSYPLAGIWNISKKMAFWNFWILLSVQAPAVLDLFEYFWKIWFHFGLNSNSTWKGHFLNCILYGL